MGPLGGLLLSGILSSFKVLLSVMMETTWILCLNIQGMGSHGSHPMCMLPIIKFVGGNFG